MLVLILFTISHRLIFSLGIVVTIVASKDAKLQKLHIVSLKYRNNISNYDKIPTYVRKVKMAEFYVLLT